MKTHLSLFCIAGLFSALAACGGPTSDGEIDPPGSLVPADPDFLAPDLASNGEYPEEVAMTSGKDDDGDYYWTHGRGYVQMPLVDVWAALREPAVVVDRREVSEFTADIDPLPEYDYSLVIHNTVHNIITVEYDSTWVHEVQEGTLAEPTQAIGVFEKTDGTQYIDIMEGSVVLIAREDSVTEVQIIEHLRATGRDEETTESYISDVFDDLLDQAYGRDLVDFD